MNPRHNTQSLVSYWGLTGLAGAVSTTAVALLLSAVVSAPAYSAPTSYMPADPDTVSTVDADLRPLGPCFMGRHSWSDATSGPPPTCRR